LIYESDRKPITYPGKNDRYQKEENAPAKQPLSAKHQGEGSG
jgi:hypothetical protein